MILTEDFQCPKCGKLVVAGLTIWMDRCVGFHDLCWDARCMACRKH